MDHGTATCWLVTFLQDRSRGRHAAQKDASETLRVGPRLPLPFQMVQSDCGPHL